MRALCFVAGLLCGLLLAIGIACKAQSLVLSGVAIHLDQEHHCNWFTKGLGYESARHGNWKYQVGFYDNSNCNLSSYAAAAWVPLKLGRITSGVIFGLVTGYRSPITPAAGLVTTYDLGRMAINLITIPPSGESGRGVLWLQLSIPWK